LQDGQAQLVIELLAPQVPRWSDYLDLAEGYDLLGQAEMSLSHSSLAAEYFERGQAYVPTADRLYRLALAYDLAGNLEMALRRYDMLLHWQESDAGQYWDFASTRADELRTLLGTPPAR